MLRITTSFYGKTWSTRALMYPCNFAGKGTNSLLCLFCTLAHSYPRPQDLSTSCAILNPLENAEQENTTNIMAGHQRVYPSLVMSSRPSICTLAPGGTRTVVLVRQLGAERAGKSFCQAPTTTSALAQLPEDSRSSGRLP